jgi:ABC-type dipeptide/oligopeptide/nickel transport system permease subunit
MSGEGAVLTLPAVDAGPGRVRSAWQRLRSSRAALIGAIIVTVFVVLGCIGLALLLVPGLDHTWKAQNLSQARLGPFAPGHLLGTDPNGRDLGARTLVAIGISFGIAITVTILSMAVGLVTGLAAGYYGGKLDTVIRMAIDVAWGFPVILLAVMLAGMMQPGVVTVVLSVALLSWAGVARVIRGYAMSLRTREFVSAARAIGVPSPVIIWKHLLPNVIGPILVLASYYIAVTIVIEAGLSFLSLGVQSPLPSLGQMLDEGRNYLRANPWLVALPGIVLAISVLGFNLLGDGLRDLFDPRMSRPQA